MLPRPRSLIAVSVKVIRLAARDTADAAKSKIDPQEGMVVAVGAAAEETVMREEKEEEEKYTQAHRDDTDVHGYSLGKNGWLLIPGVLQEGGP